jgi:hypothetical protein
MTWYQCFSALTILGALTLSAPARADIPPDDQCSASMVGKSCNNAMSNDDELQAGICKEAMCLRATPGGSITYACYRCEPVEQGAGGQPNEAGTAGQTSGASSAGGTKSGTAGTASAKGGSSNGSEPEADSDDDGGCSVSQAHGGAGALGAALALWGLVALGTRRHRSLKR